MEPTLNHDLPNFMDIELTSFSAKLEHQLKKNLQGIEELLGQSQPFTWENLMLPLEELDDELNQLWSPISHLHSVADSEALRQVFNDCQPKLVSYSMAISHNQRLFKAIESIAKSERYADLDKAQRTVIEHQLRDFKLAGVALPYEQQQQFSQLVNTLTQVSTRFEENLLDATKVWSKLITSSDELKGLPELALQTAQEAASQRQQSGWLLTLDPPSYRTVITYADSQSLRQEIYTAYVTRASDQGPFAGQWDNQPLIDQILKIRLQLAKMLGFNNYAEESLVTKMAESPQQVLDFLEKLAAKALPKAREEFAQLIEFATQNSDIKQLEAWDIAYFSEKLRQHAYTISQEELRPYFPEYRVVSGLFTILERLYGIRAVPQPDVLAWHTDASCYAIYDEQNILRSYIYLDLYARPNKRAGAWMDSGRSRRKRQDGQVQLPIAYVNCNFNGPTANKPALFTHDEVVTLFHEVGHALQHVLTRIDYAPVSGIHGVPWDAVEFPSQFFENWAWEHEAVQLISEHYITRQSLPDDLYARMIRAKNFQAAMMLMRQLEFALYDFHLHLEYDPSMINPAQTILDTVRQRTSLYPIPIFNRFQNGFSHIFGGGYAAGYYSYHWAEVLASDAFELFQQQGIFNQETSRKFMTAILETGGAEDPMDLFIRFRGRAPDLDALLRQQGIL